MGSSLTRDRTRAQGFTPLTTRVIRDLREIFSNQKEAGELPEMKKEHQRTQAGKE